ncbi:MAG: methyltransferase domain-containing protein [Candidatus Binataceae bacterium]
MARYVPAARIAMNAKAKVRTSTTYDDSFFDKFQQDALESARIVAPIVLQAIPAQSVIDIGCACGEWLAVFRDCGVRTIRGVDGEYIDRSRLLIDPQSFIAADLSRDFDAGGVFDLALCLEVAEHLPKQFARTLVRNLTAAAPVILFSAAVPGQGGADHVNERWPNYWRRLFAEQNYRMLDPIRPRIRDDRRVRWWYRQNMVIFASEGAIAGNPVLAAEAERPLNELEWVHWYVIANRNEFRFLIKALRHILARRFKYFLQQKWIRPWRRRRG